jgi:hypothetical protein
MGSLGSGALAVEFADGALVFVAGSFVSTPVFVSQFALELAVGCQAGGI